MLRPTTALPLVLLCGVVATEASARSFSSVEISGNQFVASEDITAACQIAAETDYSGSDLLALRQCLLDSGLFGSVGMLMDGETLYVVVDEINDRPGRIELGIEYDSHDGVIGTLYFERYNLFPGIFGSVELAFSDEVRAIRSSLFKANVGENLGLGLDAQFRRTDFDDQGFTSDRVLIEPFLSYRLSSNSRLEAGLGYRRDEVQDVRTDASLLFRQDEGTVSAPYARLGLRLTSLPEGIEDVDRPDVSLRIDQYFWGIGTDDRVGELRLGAEAQFPVADRLRFVLGVQAGLVKGLGGNDTRTTDRFFIGGSDFRGFAPRGVGPKDGDYFVGANRYAVASVELQATISPLFGLPTQFGGFVDIGSAWSLDSTLGGNIDDTRRQRSAVGLSLTLDINDAPLSMYIAKPLEKLPSDDEENFGLSFRSSF